MEPRAYSKVTFWKAFSLSNKFVSAINESNNSSPDNWKKYSCDRESSLIQSTFPGVLTGKNYVGVGTISKLDTISTDSISLFNHLVLIIWADKSVEI